MIEGVLHWESYLFLRIKMSDGYCVDGIEAIWLRDLIFADLELVAGQDVVVRRLKRNVTHLFDRVMRTLVAGEAINLGCGVEPSILGMMVDGQRSKDMEFGTGLSDNFPPPAVMVGENSVVNGIETLHTKEECQLLSKCGLGSDIVDYQKDNIVYACIFIHRM